MLYLILQVTPTVGVIKPGEVMEISVRDDESHISEETVEAIIPPTHNENLKNKEVTLMVTVFGNYTTENTIYRIRVRSFVVPKPPEVPNNNISTSSSRRLSINMMKSSSKHTTSIDSSNIRRSRRKS